MTICTLGALAFAACTHPDRSTKVPSAEVLFASCATCHGEAGEGNHEFGAPPIARLPAWDIEEQLHKFQTGLRGGHPDDVEGLRMRPMSRQLVNAEEIKVIAAYVERLPAAKLVATIKDSDAAAGAAAWVTCGACHGAAGEGNVALKGPPLNTLPDWYLLTQLKKFKAGVRGSAPGDVTGAQMRSMTLVLADEQAMKNVIAHLMTLPKN